MERASFVNSWTALLAPESINRNSPISIARFLPLKRIAVSPVVSRRAILGISAAAFKGPRERRSVFDSIDLGHGAWPHLVLATNDVRHATHHEAIGKLEQALLVQFGDVDDSPLRPWVIPVDDEGKLIDVEAFVIAGEANDG